MKHIIHFEDIDDLELLNRIIELVCNPMTFMSVKYDGSPAILWGNDPDFWISTKSYFNKTPVKFYSVDDIMSRERMHIKLKYKLIECFNALKGHNFGEYIYHGDLMKSKEVAISNDKYLHANVLQYDFYHGRYNEIYTSDIVIALHTAYKNEQPINVNFYPSVNNVHFFGNRIRYFGPRISPLKSLFYKDVLNVKKKILNSLHNVNLGYRVYYSTKEDSYIPTKDEGFVLKTPEGNIVKFVDRKEFTKINQNQNVKRGWSNKW